MIFFVVCNGVVFNMFVELFIEGLCFLNAGSVSMSCAAKKGEVVVQEHPVLHGVYLFLSFMIAIAKRGFKCGIGRTIFCVGSWEFLIGGS